jgi:metal-sulfur cluster biosynthetic enzyme
MPVPAEEDPPGDEASVPPSPLLESVAEALSDVLDPDLGISIVDLGLVYGIHVTGPASVTVDMTLTSATCPLSPLIEHQVGEALRGVVAEFVINWVWTPPWGPHRITQEGRQQLRALGFNV